MKVILLEDVKSVGKKAAVFIKPYENKKISCYGRLAFLY